MYRRLASSLATAAAAATVVTGCGSLTVAARPAAHQIAVHAATTPTASAGQRELARSVRALGSKRALTTTIRLAAPAAAVSDFASKDLGTTLASAQATALAGATLRIESLAPKGKTLRSQSRRGAVLVALGSHGKQYLDLEIVHGVIYLRADAKDLFTLLGKSDTYQQLSSAPSLPAFVTALLADKWVSLPVATLTSLLALLDPAAGSIAKKAAGLRTEITAVLIKDLTVTDTSAEDATTKQLTLSANVKMLGTDLLGVVTSAFPMIAGMIHVPTLPDQTVTSHATIRHGVLSRLSLNLAQLGTSASSTSAVPLVSTFARRGAAIRSPKHATPVDITKLGSLLSLVGHVRG